MHLEQIDKNEQILTDKNSYEKLSNTQKNKLMQLFIVWRKVTKEWIVQSLQRSYEHIPYVQMIDVYREQWLLSKTPIPKGSIWYKGRIARAIPQSWVVSEILINGKQIVANTQDQLIWLLDGYMIDNLDTHTAITLCSMLLWTAIYYCIIKPWDLIQIRKKRTEKNNNITI